MLNPQWKLGSLETGSWALEPSLWSNSRSKLHSSMNACIIPSAFTPEACCYCPPGLIPNGCRGSLSHHMSTISWDWQAAKERRQDDSGGVGGKGGKAASPSALPPRLSQLHPNLSPFTFSAHPAPRWGWHFPLRRRQPWEGGESSAQWGGPAPLGSSRGAPMIQKF